MHCIINQTASMPTLVFSLSRAANLWASFSLPPPTSTHFYPLSPVFLDFGKFGVKIKVDFRLKINSHFSPGYLMTCTGDCKFHLKFRVRQTPMQSRKGDVSVLVHTPKKFFFVHFKILESNIHIALAFILYCGLFSQNSKLRSVYLDEV